MTRAGALLATTLALAACQPTPRTEGYFEAHPEEAARVVAACAAGSERGEECKAATAAQAKARRALFRKGFK